MMPKISAVGRRILLARGCIRDEVQPHLATSFGLLGALSLDLALKIPHLTNLDTGRVTAMILIIASIGVITMCKIAGYWPPKKAARAKCKKPVAAA